jgi:hypothetical protein
MSNPSGQQFHQFIGQTTSNTMSASGATSNLLAQPITATPPTPTMNMTGESTTAALQQPLMTTLPTTTVPTFDLTAQTSIEGSLQCQWDTCRRIYPDPAALYRHLCDEHIGRFRQGNRCLQCRWTGCDVTTQKRDHITSHLKVHVPLREFRCEVSYWPVESMNRMMMPREYDAGSRSTSLLTMWCVA